MLEIGEINEHLKRMLTRQFNAIPEKLEMHAFNPKQLDRWARSNSVDQTKLFLKQFDQDLHCLPFSLLLDKSPCIQNSMFFQVLR